MKTIIYVGGFELPDRNAAAQRIRNNARVFRSLGYRVVLVGVSRARAYDRTLHPADNGGDDVEAWEIGYPHQRSHWFDHIRSDWLLRALTKQGIVTASEVSAVICYNYPAVAQMRIARLARRWGAAALADCTEWYARRPWTSPANIIKNLDVPLRMHCVNRRMDGLITTAPFITAFYRPTGLPMVEIPTLMEGPEGEGVTESLGRPMPLFAVASGFAEGARAESIHDRIDWILELLDGAAALGADFRLQVAGVDRSRYLSVFPRHRILLDRLGERVELLGRLPRNEVLRLLQESAFAFVLRHESRVTLAGFPSKYSEAISFGTPCIINAVPSVSAYHVEGRTGFALDLSSREGAARRLSDILAMDAQAVMAMKQYCRESRVFTAEAFAPLVDTFLSAVTKESSCRSTA
ncbi:glycosyltransferase [Pelagerythrobacter aerophilus]|uniref:Glycosyltransferase family 1 protein n=1 Tax=Pelagerythrobacter aerophilus TaxID=2306995 RepID=A0A418NFK7_9SPHN|nr:glycosyltransferase [Pelagerythrobacter aerophilus]RIV76040.1 glycosyltransferase family 1 protein [Pelagerythrobacter aerophilus]RIV80705.1 glycosyltransferase family 1 protein [Pelagerythrobacter aerophilus]